MWSAVKTGALVTLVALLIWLWAEAEGLRTAWVTPRVQFVAPSSDISVRIIDPEWRGDALRVRMEGPTFAIDEAERLLRTPLTLVPGVGGVPGEPGDQTVRLLDALRSHPELGNKGVTILEVYPETVSVRVSRLVTRELPVRVDLEDIELDGEVTIYPPLVRVTMPAQAAAVLDERGAVGGGSGTPAFATAVIEENERLLLRDDGPQTVRARVALPEGLELFDPVTVEPKDVRLTLRVRKQTDEIIIPTVPVWITMPHTEGVDWDVRVQDGLVRNVTVRGPTAEIARVRSRELVPIAFVVLSSDDLEAGVTSKLAVFAPVPAYLIDAGAGPESHRLDAALLEQLAPLQYSAENRRIELRIQKRQPSGVITTPPGGPVLPVGPAPGAAEPR